MSPGRDASKRKQQQHFRRLRQSYLCTPYVASMMFLFVLWTVVSQRELDFIYLLMEHQIPHYSQFNFVMTNTRAPMCTSLTAEQIDFTLVTQTSFNRLWLLEEHCRRWGRHPISITVGGPNLNQDDVYEQIRAMPSCHMEQITVTTVTDFHGDLDYPVNRMRNLAVARIPTSHAVYVDMDFLMSNNVYNELLLYRESLVPVQTALVLPAFELLPFCEIGTIANNQTCTEEHLNVLPNTKEEAKAIYIAPKESKYPGGITAFDRKWNPHGHLSTDYDAWFRQDESSVEPLSCVTSDKYEPYLVFRNCRDVPPFPEDFNGFGRNKIVWVQQLRRAGWRFLRMGGSFLTHLPHDKSNAFHQWRSINKAHRVNPVDDISESFRRWMIEQVPDEHVTPYCNASLPRKFIWYPESN